jgi:hypothetical protein
MRRRQGRACARDRPQFTDRAGCLEVTWGPSVLGGEIRKFGIVHKTDGTRHTFADRERLKPYIHLFETEWQRREQEQEQAAA